ncbi:Tubulin-specific chaperone A [Cryptotermes secundus]|uniref:Tubulin-specific chaperone A n=1 Tax=Cryptotermes secundus TaxID=105785 RepID=A0A2J7R510_9NEOP|nr:tubulin-specific chaperone A-like [Cryptotermes secundus]PNF35917.1 Tubulin-specific chaperone A [Cryptotermes secundus]
MEDPRIKTLRIKTGIVKRLTKEKVMYEKDADKQRQRIQKLKDEGKDEHDIRNKDEVLWESLSMVTYCQRQLVKAFDELKILLETEAALSESEEYISAKKILEEAELELLNPGAL